MKISLIIPILNEKEEIVNAIIRKSQRVLESYDDYEIIIVYKCENKTPNLINHQKIRKLEQKDNGKGNAIKLGIENSEGDILVFMDGDGSHIPEDIPNLLKPIMENKADLILASRILGGSEELHGDFSQYFRLMMTSLISLIMYWRFGVGISDTQNGFRAGKKEIIKTLNLKAKGFDIETEIVMKYLKMGYKIKEIPSHELKRKYGKTRINLFKHWYQYVWRILVNLF